MHGVSRTPPKSTKFPLQKFSWVLVRISWENENCQRFSWESHEHFTKSHENLTRFSFSRENWNVFSWDFLAFMSFSWDFLWDSREFFFHVKIGTLSHEYVTRFSWAFLGVFSWKLWIWRLMIALNSHEILIRLNHSHEILTRLKFSHEILMRVQWSHEILTRFSWESHKILMRVSRGSPGQRNRSRPKNGTARVGEKKLIYNLLYFNKAEKVHQKKQTHWEEEYV